jgi:hypothetical protein
LAERPPDRARRQSSRSFGEGLPARMGKCEVRGALLCREFDLRRASVTILPMKQLFTVILVAIVAVSGSAAWREKNPAQAIRNFYSWYVAETVSGNRPLQKQRDLMRKFVTDRLLSGIDKMAKGPAGSDGDYFLNAQEIDPDWGKNIAIGNNYIGKTMSKLSVILSGRKLGDRQFDVKVVFQDGTWKIDEIKFTD